MFYQLIYVFIIINIFERSALFMVHILYDIGEYNVGYDISAFHAFRNPYFPPASNQKEKSLHASVN